MFDIVDRIANWVAESSEPDERYLWVLNHQTTEITWKSRKVYSFWQSSESGSLQEIFREMAYQLPYSHHASSHDEFQNLVGLRERITKSYEGFLKAHDSFFGMIYQYFFAYDLTDNYDQLINKLNKIILDSFSQQDISSLSPQEIESLAKAFKKNNPYSSPDIDWEALSLEQFQAACKMEGSSKPIPLECLDKEKTTVLLERDKERITRCSKNELQQNLDNIEPRFLCQLSGRVISSLDLSTLNSDDLADILKKVSFYSHELHFVDLSLFTSDQINDILRKNPSLLEKLPPQTVADNLSKIDLIYYKNLSADQQKALDLTPFSSDQINELLKKNPDLLPRLSDQTVSDNLSKIDVKYYGSLTHSQVGALDFSQLTGDQFMKVAAHTSMYDDKQLKNLNLNLFTAKQLSQLAHDHYQFIRNLSPQQVAANLSKFDVALLGSLTSKQIQALDFSQLTIEQLVQIKSDEISDQQWLKVNLANFTNDSISKLLKSRHYILQKLSPSTVAANLGRIETSHYDRLSDEQLKAIDYNQLKDVQKKAFTQYQMQKMKNYPKRYYGYGDWDDGYFTSFFGSFGAGKQSSYNPFSGFGFRADDEWEKQYFEPAQDDKLKPYQSNLTSAITKIKALNKSNTEPVYENLRQKCLKRGKELENNPELVFVDDAKTFDAGKLKQYYKKMILVFHPDKNQNNLEEATELFKVINEAYKYLMPSS